MMQHGEFTIGKTFRCGDKRWRCTDVGTRVIVAICLDHDDDPSWYNGPPYAVAESVFDEYDMNGCAKDADEELRETQIESLRQQVQEGRESGPGIPADKVFDGLESKYSNPR